MTSDIATTQTITVNPKLLAGLLTDLLLFTSKNGTLPALNAIQLQYGTVNNKPVLIARATDRYALAEAWIETDEDSSWPAHSMLIPVDAVKQILAVAKTAGILVQLKITEGARGSQITADNFSTQSTVFCTDAEFPSISSFWDQSHVDPQNVMNFEASALARPSAVAKRRKTSLRMHIDRKANILVTIDDNFRAVIMGQNNKTEDDMLYVAPTTA